MVPNYLEMALQFLPPPEPRPVETWTHLYRVSFWQQQTPPPGSHLRPEDAGWSEEYWDISAEDVHEVMHGPMRKQVLSGPTRFTSELTTTGAGLTSPSSFRLQEPIRRGTQLSQTGLSASLRPNRQATQPDPH